MKFLKNNWPIILIVTLGLCLRLHHLTSQSLFDDEITTVIGARSNVLNFGYLSSYIYSDLNPPLYVIILHFWIKIFGVAEISLRSLSVIFGTLSILAIYKVGSLLFNRKVALLAAFFLAISSFNVSFSQEVRMYSLMALLSLASIYFYILLLKKPSIEYAFSYFIFSLLLLFSHTFGFLTIIAENVFFFSIIFLKNKPYARLGIQQWLLIQIGLLMIFSPWFSIMYRQMNQMTSSFDSLLEMTHMISGNVIIFIVSTVLIGAAIWQSSKRYKNSQRKKILLYGLKFLTKDPNVYFLMINIMVVFLIPTLIFHFYHLTVNIPRVMITISLAVFLLIAKGLTNIQNYFIKIVLILLLIYSFSVHLVSYYRNPTNNDWRSLGKFVDQRIPKNEKIITIPEWNDPYLSYYIKGKDIEIIPILDEPNAQNLNYQLEKLEAEAIKSQQFYLVTGSFSSWYLLQPEIIEALSAFDLISVEDFLGIHLYYFEKKSLSNYQN